MRNPNFYHNQNSRSSLSFTTQAVRGATGGDAHTGAISHPIYQTATFEHCSITDNSGYNYSRCINPTREELERTMCLLEGGSRAFAVSSGMAAMTLVTSLLTSGDHVILSDDVYGGTYRCVNELLSPNQITFDCVDLANLDLLAATITPSTKMILIETPTNPMMKVSDIQAISALAASHGILTVVDNTFLTPYFQTPLKLGADIVLHSGTKYLAGHNDTLAGIVVVKDEELGDQLEIKMYIFGAGLSPMDSWLTLRGLKTLVLRMNCHNDNALKMAHWLRAHPKVSRVYYVGFEDHDGYAITKRQTTGFSGVISFDVGSTDRVDHILSHLKLIIFAESLGGVETLITHPVSRTHTEISAEKREALGLTDSLLRISVGIECIDDLISDLSQAFGDEP